MRIAGLALRFPQLHREPRVGVYGERRIGSHAGRYGSPQNHKREGAVSVSAIDETCRPMDATTIELPDLPIYSIEAGLGDHCGFGDRAVVDVDP